MMRQKLLLVLASLALTTGLATARPLDVHVHVHRYHAVRAAPVAAYLVRHGLLSPQQAACAMLVPGPLGSRRVSQLSVFQTSGGRCPGVPQPPTYLFDVYVDRVSGVVDVTTPDHDLQTVL